MLFALTLIHLILIGEGDAIRLFTAKVAGGTIPEGAKRTTRAAAQRAGIADKDVRSVAAVAAGGEITLCRQIDFTRSHVNPDPNLDDILSPLATSLPLILICLTNHYLPGVKLVYCARSNNQASNIVIFCGAIASYGLPATIL